MRNHTAHGREALEYQEAMLGELCRMASEHKQGLLGYLLGMAYMEVCEQLGRPKNGALPTSAAAIREMPTH